MAAVLAAIRKATDLSASGQVRRPTSRLSQLYRQCASASALRPPLTAFHAQEGSATGAPSSSPLPGWLLHLLTVLRDTHAPANVRLFLLQVLLNHPASTIAAPWCHKVRAE